MKLLGLKVNAKTIIEFCDCTFSFIFYYEILELCAFKQSDNEINRGLDTKTFRSALIAT